MRLNFAGVPDEEIREGIRRIGKALREQVGLYGTLSGSGATPRADANDSSAAGSPPVEQPAPEQDSPLADVVALPRHAQEDSPRRRQDR
jgi:2-aminoadipate transaminase